MPELEEWATAPRSREYRVTLTLRAGEPYVRTVRAQSLITALAEALHHEYGAHDGKSESAVTAAAIEELPP